MAGKSVNIEAGKTYVGVVEDNVDPEKIGRCKVRVLNVFDDFKVEDLPFASPWKDLNGNGSNIPEKGKVLIVVFDGGDVNKPEFISSDHYNINLENKLKSLSGDNYLSMKSLIFDHKTQIYVNNDEGLKIDHKYNNINITENTIDLNLKDNQRHVNIGDATAGQQAILGNHWMDWFDEFVDNLMGNKGGPYLGNLGAPVIANPALIQVLMKYKQLRDPVFLSHHVNIVDNDKISTVRNTNRQDTAQVGDKWTSTKVENNLTSNTNDSFKPVDGPKPEYDDKHVETPPIPESPTNNSTNNNNTNQPSATASVIVSENKPVSDINSKPINNTLPSEPLSSTKSNPKVDRLIKFLKSKNYTTYDSPGILNLVAMRNSKKDKGEITNKFDDILNVFYINKNGNWELLEYQITTVPGYKEGSEVLPVGVGILLLGQYIDQCTITLFQNEKDNKCLLFSSCKIYKNDSATLYNYKSKTVEGRFPLSIHRSSTTGSAENVYNYSQGAQVFKNITQFNQFMQLCEDQVSIKSTFTYTLCKQSEFDEFI